MHQFKFGTWCTRSNLRVKICSSCIQPITAIHLKISLSLSLSLSLPHRRVLRRDSSNARGWDPQALHLHPCCRRRHRGRSRVVIDVGRWRRRRGGANGRQRRRCEGATGHWNGHRGRKSEAEMSRIHWTSEHGLVKLDGGGGGGGGGCGQVV